MGTILSGDRVTVLAGQDINVLGSNVVSTKGTVLDAGNNVNILSATNTSQQTHFKQEKESGLLSSGGIGFTISSRMQSTDQQGAQTSATASTIGSTEGDVLIAAGKNYTQVGSNVVAPQGNIDITAQRVDILAAQETGKNTTQTKFEQSGLTIALTSPIITALQTAIQMKSAAQDTKDARMKVLAGASTVMAAQSAATAVGAAPQGSAGGFGISITVGGSQNKSTTTETADTAAVSQVAAGKDISITAKGAGKESDLTLQGAQVAAGNNVRLQAEDELNLVATRSESDLQRDSSGSSGGIGVAVQVGKGVAAGITVNGSLSQGKADGQNIIYTNTHVVAGNTATLESGGDTNLKGAVVAGNKVVADVGGNLNIESLQDSSVYASKDQSIGGSITVGYGYAAGSAGVGKDSGSAGSTTKSGISGITGNKEVRAGDAESGITKIFDADKVQQEINAQVQITQAFGQQAPKAVADFAKGQADSLREQAKNEPDPDKKAGLKAEAERWDEGGAYRVALHTVVGAMVGGVEGAAGAAATASRTLKKRTLRLVGSFFSTSC